MEWLPILQGLSTPVLIGAVWIGYRVIVALHGIDTRLAIVEHELKAHRLTEKDT